MAPPPPPLPPYPQQSQPDYDNLPGSDSDSEDGEIHYKDDYEESRSTPLPLESHVLPGFFSPSIITSLSLYSRAVLHFSAQTLCSLVL